MLVRCLPTSQGFRSRTQARDDQAPTLVCAARTVSESGDGVRPAMAKARPKPIRAESRTARCRLPGITYTRRKQPRSRPKKIILNLPFLSVFGAGRASRCAPASHGARVNRRFSRRDPFLSCVETGAGPTEQEPVGRPQDLVLIHHLEPEPLEEVHALPHIRLQVCVLPAGIQLGAEDM